MYDILIHSYTIMGVGGEDLWKYAPTLASRKKKWRTTTMYYYS